MMSRTSLRRTALGTAVLLAGIGPGAAQEPPAAQPTFGAATSVVLVDVVVRDDDGKVVRDLKQEDFEIYENGVRQEVLSFEVVSRDGPQRAIDRPRVAGAPQEPGTPAGPPPALVALVFDRLTPNARSLAKRAARTYVERAADSGDLVGVYSVGFSLRTLQVPTDDTEALLAAVDRAVDASTALHESARERIRELTRQAQQAAPAESGPAGTGADAGAAAASAGAAAGQADATAGLLDMEMRMFRTLESIERDQQGYASVNGLLAVVNALRLQPGRKTAVVFSEGLSIPPNVEPKFQALIDAANRGNVAVYTMDAAGLRAESTRALTRDEMLAAGRNQIAQRSSGRDDFTGSLTQELERNEDRLRLDPHTGLGALARETGGFLVSETNDLAAAARRVEEEVRFHYLLSYSPVDSRYDGRFRNIEVKVSRPDARVRSRNGYFALRPDDPWPVQPYEAPALALLGQDPPPGALSIRGAGLSMPQPDRTGLVPLLVEVPGHALTFAVDEKKDEYRGDFVVLARVRDAAGRVVERTSRHYLLSGPAADGERARTGDVLFYREVDLDPGHYTVEAIVHDRLADAAGVTRAGLDVAEPGVVRMSSLLLVKKVERMTEEEGESHPLRFGESLLYPNLGQPIRKSEQTQLAFFLKAMLPDGAQPEATLEILQKGQSLGQVPLQVPSPAAGGYLEHMAAIPIAGFPAGDYSLRVTLSAGGSSASSEVGFTVQE